MLAHGRTEGRAELLEVEFKEKKANLALRDEQLTEIKSEKAKMSETARGLELKIGKYQRKEQQTADTIAAKKKQLDYLEARMIREARKLGDGRVAYRKTYEAQRSETANAKARVEFLRNRVGEVQQELTFANNARDKTQRVHLQIPDSPPPPIHHFLTFRN